ncbi:hypothetical protein F4813DRAFT_364265 [Daldinia decipiens]|uniref:uncharacterized protein n=1 Tax=Daldinia decipiens TaxID=326647 RepID=UPI0020C1D709|nr:uncharacterized protein F4813DRAFT_364265 [Daldinia decipiens]KAI1656408.1 hypothetical protein F4813DRAFT_364265 [Daldinia decipiens]
MSVRPTWAAELPHIFAACGFVDIEEDAVDPPPHLAFMLHKLAAIHCVYVYVYVRGFYLTRCMFQVVNTNSKKQN